MEFKGRWGKGFVLTLIFLKFLVQTRFDVSLQLAQSGWPQFLKVNLDFILVGVAHGRLSCLNDVHHATQLDAGQAVNVKAQLVLLVVCHRQTFAI